MKGARIALGLLVLVTLGVRLASLGTYPLADTTEARYAEIARVMLESGDWITPQLVPGEPFWAKPPLSIWMTAVSFAMGGVSAFTARLPAFLVSCFTLVLLYRFARERHSCDTALAAVAIAASTVLGFVAAGAVMTDPALLATTTLAMLAFRRATTRPSRAWSALFFVALGLGLLAKGPVATVLVLMPVALWTLWAGAWRTVLDSFRWGEGLAIVLVLTVPWYLAAELRTPGFLRYFIVGEHLQRFLDSGWSGDRYGTAHERPRGTIWLFALAAFLPWSILVPLLAARRWRRRASGGSLTDEQRYLCAWLLAPMLLFTLAGNILPTYVLPALPAFALLSASALTGAWRTSRPVVFGSAALLVPALVASAGPLGIVDSIAAKSQERIVALARERSADGPLVYFGTLPHSARFYSRGEAIEAADVASLARLTGGTDRWQLVVREEDEGAVPETLRACLAPLARRDGRTLYERARGRTCDVLVGTRSPS